MRKRIWPASEPVLKSRLSVAAEVTRLRFFRENGRSEPPHVGCYDFQNRLSRISALQTFSSATTAILLFCFVASDDEEGGDGAARVTFSAVAGAKYYLAVDGFAGDEGQFTLQPRDRTAAANESVTFNVTALGAFPLFYQWRFGGTPLPGQTNAALTVDSARRTNSGLYSVAVTGPGGTVGSRNALLRVLIPQRFQLRRTERHQGTHLRQA